MARRRRATTANRRRVRGARGKRLQRKRSELVERSFAHVCETGGARRTWLRGLENVTKLYVVQVAAHNLGLLMRRLFGVGTPRALQGAGGVFVGVVACWYWLLGLPKRLGTADRRLECKRLIVSHTCRHKRPFSTGCYPGGLRRMPR